MPGTLTQTITGASVAARRLLQQRISQSGIRRPADVVDWFGAMQAQEYGPAKWAIGLRLAGDALDADVERGFETGQILRTHVLRPTWHFVTATDIRWLLELTGPRVQQAIAHYSRQLELDSGTVTRGLDVIGCALREGQYLTRKELADHLRAAGLPMTGPRLGLMTIHAESAAIVCSGPRRGRQHTYALLADRAPRALRLSRDEALAALSRRFFKSHGPATVRDFSWWSGLTMADARRGLAMNRSKAVEIDGLTYWTIGQPPLEGGQRRIRKIAPTQVHLLPIYDEYLIAYRDRVAVPHRASGGRPTAAAFQHALVIDGQVAGSWRTSNAGASVRLQVDPARRLSIAERDALARAARRYERFLGTPVEVVRSR